MSREPRPLTRAALALRGLHAAISVAFLSAIGYVWWCGLTGKRGPLLRACVAALTCEGVAVTANGGDCPLGGLQERAGDPVPLFELVLSPRAAKRAVPALGGVAAAGIALVAVHRPASTPPAPILDVSGACFDSTILDRLAQLPERNPHEHPQAVA